MLNQKIITVKSKQAATEIAKMALSDKEIYQTLLINCESSEIKLAQKSAWVISAMFDIDHNFFKPQVKPLWSLLLKNQPSALERSLIRIVSKFEIPEEIESVAFDFCMNRLTDTSTAIANRAMAFDIAYKLATKYPALTQELKLVIPLLTKLASPGLMVKVKRFEK